MFRSLSLPAGITGRLYLHCMPGRKETMEDFRLAVAKEKISAVISLTGLEEINNISPSYAGALATEGIGCQWIELAVPDFGLPDDTELYKNQVLASAAALKKGEKQLVHCRAGIGRTGTFAVCLLGALGMNYDEARRTVQASGSDPETLGQASFTRHFFENMNSQGK